MSAVTADLERVLDRALAQFPDHGRGYLQEINEIAWETAAGRGGRFLIALDDLHEAIALARTGGPSERELAQIMLDNALPHLGRILSDQDDRTLLPHLADLAERYGQLRGPAQLDYLHSRGLLDADQLAELRPRAGELYRQALTSSDRRPQWAAINLMERSERARQRLADAQSHLDGDATRMAEKVSGQLGTITANCQKYLRAGSARDAVLAQQGPQKVTRAEILAHAFTDPQLRALNSAFERSDLLASHRQLLSTVGRVPDRPIVVVSDHRWLDQLMNYQAMITDESRQTIAINSGSSGVLLSEGVGRQALAARDRGGYDPTVLHEGVHTTQPRKRGTVINEDHRRFENELCEGGTQALTNMLRRENDPTYVEGEPTAYPGLTALIDAFAARQPASERREFYVGHSATPTSQRAAYLLSSVGLDASPETIGALVDELQPPTEMLESQGAGGPWAVKQLSDRLARFVSEHVPAPALAA